MWLYYRGIVREDLVNAYKGIHCTIFFQGCSHQCEGCFNPETWEFGPCQEGIVGILTNELQDIFIRYCNSSYIDAISISGGDPLDQDIDAMYEFLKRLKTEVNKPIYCWTGHLYENIVNGEKSKLLEFIDVLIDGEFQIAKKQELTLRGSTNQRVIDVRKSLECNELKLFLI